MGLASLLVSILAIIILFLSFVGSLVLGFIAIIPSFVLALLSLIFGIIGARKKEGTATAGIVLSVLLIAAELFLLFVIFKGRIGKWFKTPSGVFFLAKHKRCMSIMWGV